MDIRKYSPIHYYLVSSIHISLLSSLFIHPSIYLFTYSSLFLIIYLFIYLFSTNSVIGGYQKLVEAFSLKQTIATINSYKEHSLKNVTSPEKNVPHVTSPEKNIPEVSATSTSPAQNVPHSRSSITENVLHSSLITKHVPFSPSCTYFQSDCAVTSTYEALVAYR